jgi:hypothetical protein
VTARKLGILQREIGMTQIQESIIDTAQRLTASERREVFSRLLVTESEAEVGTVWKTVRFSEKLRVVAFAPEQGPFIDGLRELLQGGALIRLENEAEGTCEVYGTNRTYYVTMSERREFVGLLSSWSAGSAPREINVER